MSGGSIVTAHADKGIYVARAFLAVVGTAYICLAIWCAAQPDATAKSVGFELIPGSGQSEYFVIYGGLELALGIAFLWPLRRKEDTGGALRLCCLIHSCLVVFRTVSLVSYSGVGRTTYMLAAVEWLILLGALFVASMTDIEPESEQRRS